MQIGRYHESHHSWDLGHIFKHNKDDEKGRKKESKCKTYKLSNQLTIEHPHQNWPHELVKTITGFKKVIDRTAKQALVNLRKDRSSHIIN